MLTLSQRTTSNFFHLIPTLHLTHLLNIKLFPSSNLLAYILLGFIKKIAASPQSTYCHDSLQLFCVWLEGIILFKYGSPEFGSYSRN